MKLEIIWMQREAVSVLLGVIADKLAPYTGSPVDRAWVRVRDYFYG